MAIQLYGFWRSIAAFRVRVALRLKGLPFEGPHILPIRVHHLDQEFVAPP